MMLINNSEYFEVLEELVVDLLPWRNNITLMSKVKDEAERNWYIEQNLENGWNNTVLIHQIEMKIYQRQMIAEKTSNYERVLEKPFSVLAEETLKNPYVFDFVSEYRLSDFVPAEFVDTLPSAEDIEKRVRLEYDLNEDENGGNVILTKQLRRVNLCD